MNMAKMEKAVLVGVKTRKTSQADFESSMQELQGLAEAAGAEAIMTMVQAKDRPVASSYIGKGKMEELQHLVEEMQPDLVIFDSELSPVQLRNLEEAIGIKVVDRTMLILDIFSQRARTREGNLQVELANLEYRLPRLTGRGAEMARLSGGIGTRGGAGEQKIELDRRRIRNRIRDIKGQMEKVRQTRELHRKQRQRVGLKTVSLVGYTNAGKSSLFNALCKSAHRRGDQPVEADQRLFQTLDTTTRKISLPGGTEVLITDTVGFIQNLPHHLVAAFRSTLEEAVDADILLHVVDASGEDSMEKERVVEKVLQDLGGQPERIMTAYNKTDLLDYDTVNDDGQVFVSAKTGAGLQQLLVAIEARLNQ